MVGEEFAGGAVVGGAELVVVGREPPLPGGVVVVGVRDPVVAAPMGVRMPVALGEELVVRPAAAVGVGVGVAPLTGLSLDGVMVGIVVVGDGPSLLVVVVGWPR